MLLSLSSVSVSLLLLFLLLLMLLMPLAALFLLMLLSMAFFTDLTDLHHGLYSLRQGSILVISRAAHLQTTVKEGEYWANLPTGSRLFTP